jgi:hypothetical protein
MKLPSQRSRSIVLNRHLCVKGKFPLDPPLKLFAGPKAVGRAPPDTITARQANS